MIFVRAVIIGLILALVVIPALMMVGLWEDSVIVGLVGALVGFGAAVVAIGMEGR